VLVVREYLVQPLPAHRLHRDAVSEAETVVWSSLVQPKTGKKALVGLRQDLNRTVRLHPLHQLDGRTAKVRPAGAEVIDELGEDLFGGDDTAIRQTPDIAVRVSKGLTERRIVTADPTSFQREPRPDVCCPAFCSRSRSRMLRFL